MLVKNVVKDIIASRKTIIFLVCFFNSKTICNIFLAKDLKINYLFQILLKQLDYSLSISMR